MENAMKVLLVAPVEIGSGETVTLAQIATRVAAAGGSVRILASSFARHLLGAPFANRIIPLTDDGDTNRALWATTLRRFRPDIVLFGDYPLLSFARGVAPLYSDAWVRKLDEADTHLVTLDHTGYAQRAMTVYFGPPHLSLQHEAIPAIPARMEILLPCPMHEPAPVAGRKGHPFRYWEVPLTIAEVDRQRVRRRYLADNRGFLIVHAAARWTWEGAASAGLPYYQMLPWLLERYLAGLPRPVTVVSVNNGHLLEPVAGGVVQIVNLPSIPSVDYDRLLLSADLLLTENKISISLGKAICAGIPAVSLRNSWRFRALLARCTGEMRELVISMEAHRPGAIFSTLR